MDCKYRFFPILSKHFVIKNNISAKYHPLYGSIFINFVALKHLLTIFIILTIAIRPALPLANYAFNYGYIVKNLCEKRNQTVNTCKGKCYLAKEISKTEKQTQNNEPQSHHLDFFVIKDSVALEFKTSATSSLPILWVYKTSPSYDYFSDIFRPPLV